MNILQEYLSFMSNLVDMFAGNFVTSNHDYDEMTRGIKDISHIPTPQDDKAILQQDINNVSRDLSKAKKEYDDKYLAHG